MKKMSEAGESDYKPTGNGETILFVDDEENQQRLMRRFFESEGYNMIAAKDGLEAVQLYLKHKAEIAVVVLDLGLPRLGGWEALQQMREIQPDVKALIATGLLSPEVEAEMAQAKLAGVLMKPYQLDDVLAKIDAIIQARPALTE